MKENDIVFKFYEEGERPDPNCFGCLTICHRILLHENLGEAHRKHAYQLMANELKIGHVKVSLLYMFMQLAVSLGFIYLCPDTVAAHWGYLAGAVVVTISH